MIDAHQHFWRLGEHDCSWPTEAEAAIHCDFLPADWEAVALPCGVTGSVLVQSQESARDTLWLLELAGRHDFILGVVGWADLTLPLPRSPWLKGLRPMVQGYPAGFLDNPALDPGLAAMAEQGLVFDALVRPRHLPELERLALRHPTLSIVVDHAAKPDFANGISDWQLDLDNLAGFPNISCKLSGLVTEIPARHMDWAIAWLFDLFGPDRLIWGSDWPVLNLAGSYAGWLAQAKAAIPSQSRAAVFNDNARRIYKL
ncbi:amidohydrolase family protein [Sphingomonas sp. LB-2]|uniref:amidohydrolase family protein n=1 Tax=Sphingomonas caeni TaxID=2984949 RepID=UPI002232427B|nr:amidohydrolase family protein [Sphingomonas caeni]MCW3848876.1 amidohydrolase family protein [Sphingomonas caeni]